MPLSASLCPSCNKRLWHDSLAPEWFWCRNETCHLYVRGVEPHYRIYLETGPFKNPDANIPIHGGQSE